MKRTFNNISFAFSHTLIFKGFTVTGRFFSVFQQISEPEQLDDVILLVGQNPLPLWRVLLSLPWHVDMVRGYFEECFECFDSCHSFMALKKKGLKCF